MRDLPQRVLIVEDSLVQRQQMVSLCQELGIAEVIEAANGREAIQLLRDSTLAPNLLIVDLEMPDMDGIQVLQEVWRLKLVLPIVVVSYRESALLSSVETMCQSLGINLLGALPKPVSAAQLSDTLTSMRNVLGPTAKTDQTAPQISVKDLVLALREHQFMAYFQPKVTVHSGMIKGVEALIRWQHPEHGLLYPGAFIDYVEHTPLIHDLTLEMLDISLRQMQAWHQGGLRISTSVNLSARSLNNPNFADVIIERVNACGVDPHYLLLEVTETAIMADLGTALGALARLRLKGFGLAIDDFGTGFSSMQQLSRAPFTELKIDRSFVNQAHRRPHLRVMLETAIKMTQKLDLTVVAEGVETHEDWALLRELDCELAQGYLIAKPMPGAQLHGWLKDNTQRLREL